MPSRSDLQQRIASLTNIQKVTGAMNTIASLRFRKLVEKQAALEKFESELSGWLLATPPLVLQEEAFSAAVQGRASKNLAVVFTSDRGLCGAHNHSVHRVLDRFVRDTENVGKTVELVCIGNKGSAYARRRGYRVVQQKLAKEPTVSELRELADHIVDQFLTGEVGTVELIYNRFVSMLRQITQERTILPLAKLVEQSSLVEQNSGSDPTFDEKGLRLAVRYLLAVAFAHSAISEQAARRTAMDNASKNARDLTTQAVKEQNRARQAGITGEIIEIVSGKEAMKRSRP